VRFSLFARGGAIEGAMAEGSIVDPGTHPSVLAVGAVRATSYLGHQAESFSSHGPTNAGLAKPDIAGPDGLSSSVYGETGFYGTSASTPAVTAALAILMSADPDLDPYEAAARLRAWAWDERATFDGPDMALGAGYARLPPLHGQRHGCGDRPLLLPVLLAWPLAGIRRRLRPDASLRSTTPCDRS
jgi:subtilisin family serine protease